MIVSRSRIVRANTRTMRPNGILEPAGEVGVVQQSRELQHEFVADWETSQVHRTYVLYPASGFCQVAETDVAA
jgi:hypothetical protein